MEDYFEIMGNPYYIDIEELSKFIRLDENPLSPLELPPANENDDGFDTGQMVDMTKWDMVKGMIETIFTEQIAQYDEKMGIVGLASEVSLAFKLAFNTLLRYNIIKEIE